MIIIYYLDLAVQNAWQLHRLHGGKLNRPTFRGQIVLALLQTNKSCRKRSRPSSLENVESRFDNASHYTVPQEKQTRCSVCHKRVLKKCAKCKVP
jgi:hypothetical protein